MESFKLHCENLLTIENLTKMILVSTLNIDVFRISQYKALKKTIA